MTVVQEENLAAVEIKARLVAVEANLGGGLTKVLVGVVALIAGAIKVGYKVVEELIVFIQYKVSELKVSGVTVIVGRVNGIYIKSKIKQSFVFP